MKKNKKDWIKIIAITIAISQTIVLFIFWSIEPQRASYPETMPSDFNFVASFENDSYKIDTYKNNYTKTLNWDKDTTIKLYLTKNEKNLIYKIITKIDILKYPKNYAPTSTICITPSSNFFISVTLDGIYHTINWSENTESRTKDAKKIKKVI